MNRVASLLFVLDTGEKYNTPSIDGSPSGSTLYAYV
jgi:hypothetical protein